MCICDDLPHVIHAVEEKQKYLLAHELVQSGVILQVGFGKSLIVRVDVNDNNSCSISPQEEVRKCFLDVVLIH